MKINLSFKSALSILFLISTLLIFSGTDYMSLKGCDESYYTQISREMLLSKNLIITTYNANPVFEKPPFLFWNQLIVFKYFGIGDFQARLPIFFYSIITVLLISTLVFNETKKAESAFVSGGIVITSFIFMQLSHQVMMDIPVMCFLTLLTLGVQLIEKNKKYGVLAGISFGLIILTKGALAFLLLICISPFIYRKKVKLDLYLIGGIITGFLPVTYWYGMLSLNFGKEFWDVHLWQQVIGRASTAMFPVSSLGPLTYIVNMTWLFLPWTFLIIPFFITSWKIKKNSDLAFLSISFFIIYFLTIHLMKTAFNHYTLPLLIPISIMGGIWLNDKSENKSKKLNSIFINLYGVLSALLLIAIILVYLGVIVLDPNLPEIILLPVFLLALSFAGTSFSRLKKASDFIMLSILIFGTSIAYLFTEFVIHPWNSEPEIRQVIDTVPTKDKIYFVSKDINIDFCFYAAMKYYKQEKTESITPDKLLNANKGWYYGRKELLNISDKDQIIMSQGQWQLIKK